MRELSDACFGHLFATPLLEHVWADASELNAQLSECILDHERRHPGTELTNVGVWHSAAGRLEFCGVAGRRLMQHMSEMVEEATHRLYAQFGASARPLEWILSAWANINRKGDFNQMHTHPGATWSGVYYVDHGETHPAAEGTVIHLFDPCASRANIFFPELSCRAVTFRPQPGLMILFPGYVPHAVLPHRGERARISIAFNVRRDPFP